MACFCLPLGGVGLGVFLVARGRHLDSGAMLKLFALAVSRGIKQGGRPQTARFSGRPQMFGNVLGWLAAMRVTVGQVVDDRAIRPVVAVAMRGQVLERADHDLQLLELGAARPPF